MDCGDDIREEANTHDAEDRRSNRQWLKSNIPTYGLASENGTARVDVLPGAANGKILYAKEEKKLCVLTSAVQRTVWPLNSVLLSLVTAAFMSVAVSNSTKLFSISALVLWCQNIKLLYPLPPSLSRLISE